VPQELFRRSFRVTVGSKQFGSVDVERPISFSFSVDRDTTAIPNSANVTLWNLAPDTRAELEALATSSPGGVPVRVEAGYGDRIGQIFFGGLGKVASWREGADWVTELAGGDGEKQIVSARINRSFARGTPVSAVLRALVTQLGVDPGGLGAINTPGFSTSGTSLSRSMTFRGDAAQALEAFCRSLGLRWSVQDGAFFAAPDGEATVPGQGPLFSPETGLIETPTVDKDGKVNGIALLNGELIPGRIFRVESSRVTGNFLCTACHYYGESQGDTWYIEFEGTPPAKGSRAASS
jgi:hypothetical protein